MDRGKRVISKENGRGNPASARSENIQNSPSILPILGVYQNLISDVNELYAIPPLVLKSLMPILNIKEVEP
jgi:hypothetical protein